MARFMAREAIFALIFLPGGERCIEFICNFVLNGRKEEGFLGLAQKARAKRTR